MSDEAMNPADRAAELRRAFDRSFAEPVAFDATARTDVLVIRVGAETCAIRLADVSGLFVDKKITRVPGSEAALLGIAGFRGAIMPVFSLHSLLGHAAAGVPRWLVVAAAAPVALAFDAFERQLSVAPDALVQQPSGIQALRHAREFLRTSAEACPVIHLPSILGAIKMQKPDMAPGEER